MKQVCKCENCEQIKALKDTFSARLNEPVTDANGNVSMKKRVIRICRLCASKAGYKVKGIDNE